jgi:hypothetical protein
VPAGVVLWKVLEGKAEQKFLPRSRENRAVTIGYYTEVLANTIKTRK